MSNESVDSYRIQFEFSTNEWAIKHVSYFSWHCILNPWKFLVVLSNLHCLKIICSDIANRSQIYSWFNSVYSKSQFIFPLIHQSCQLEDVYYRYYSNRISITVFITKFHRKYFLTCLVRELLLCVEVKLDTLEILL